MSTKKFAVVGLGNAIMDALIILEDDAFLAEHNLTKGIMHPVDNSKWMEVYAQLHAPNIALQTGGSCANTIAALGLMGAEVSYCGHIGQDDFAELYRLQMQDACGHHSLLQGEGHTGKCLSLVSPDAERTMLTNLGTSIQLSSIDHFIPIIKDSQVFHSTGYLLLGDPMKSHLIHAATIAKENGVLVSFDVADPSVIQAIQGEMKSFIEQYVDIVFLNEAEAKAIAGSDNAAQAIELLKDSCQVIVVKLGSRGSMVYTNGETAHAGIFKVQAVDTTGAGDSFAAGFLYGWTHGLGLQRSIQLASRVAAETVAQLGAVVREHGKLQSLIQEIG